MCGTRSFWPDLICLSPLCPGPLCRRKKVPKKPVGEAAAELVAEAVGGVLDEGLGQSEDAEATSTTAGSPRPSVSGEWERRGWLLATSWLVVSKSA